jgi:glycogen operon protein
VAFSAELRRERLLFHVILNAYWEPLDFELPRPESGASWRRWIDTALESPHDIVPWQTAPTVSSDSYRTEARSVAMLYAVSSG